MKTIILMTAMFLTVAFARPAAAEDKLVLFSGFLAEVETVQFVGDKIIVDGSGKGYSTLGSFTMTRHAEINPVTGTSKGSSEFTFAKGDTFCTTDIGLGDLTGVGDIGVETVLQKFSCGTGRFASGAGDLTLERMVHTVEGDSDSFGSFRGEFLKTAP